MIMIQTYLCKFVYSINICSEKNMEYEGINPTCIGLFGASRYWEGDPPGGGRFNPLDKIQSMTAIMAKFGRHVEQLNVYLYIKAKPYYFYPIII